MNHNWVPSQGNVCIVAIEWTLQREITRFQVLRRTKVPALKTNKSMKVSFPVRLYAETSSSADINPKSCNLTALELINPQHCIYFPCLEHKIFCKILSLRCRCLLRCDFVTSLWYRSYLICLGLHSLKCLKDTLLFKILLFCI